MPPFMRKIRTATLGEKSNPYVKRDNPSNPTYNPTTVRQDADPLSPPSELATSASPRNSVDFLAEARLASGRDAVTGKAKPKTTITLHETTKVPKKAKSFKNLRNRIRGSDGRDSSNAAGIGVGSNSGNGNSGKNPATDTDPANPFADPVPPTNPNDARYEQYIWQMREREMARLAWREPEGGSFYAPPLRR